MSAKPDSLRVARRVCRILALLKGHSIDGVALSDLARALDEPVTTTLRALEAMAEEDAVKKLDNGRWALSMLSLRIHASHATEITRAESRIADLKQGVAAGARY